MALSTKSRQEVFRELYRELYGGSELEPDGGELFDELPEELEQLYQRITCEATVRAVVSEACPGSAGESEPCLFEGFETIDAQIGGMGLVIEAHDPGLDRKVAIKLWKRSGPKAEAALLAEAKTLARLNHPNVVRVYGTGRWRDRVYFVMEWVEGCNGNRWLKQGPTTLAIRDAYVEAAKGLAAAHEAGIQHRDFKPSNMLVGEDGRVLVADFGVADRLRPIVNVEGEEGSRPTGLTGTLPYIAPERLRGGRGDGRSDQYSLCVALWESLHGVRPYLGSSREELLAAIERGRLAVGGEREPIPGWLDQAVRKGLAEDPKLRHRDMHALIEALRGEPGERGEPAKDERRLELGDSSRRARPGQRWTFSGGLALGLGIALLVSLSQGRRPSERRERGDERAASWVAPASASPCAAPSLGAVEPVRDPVLLQVCRLIREDRYEAADMLWERERAIRLSQHDESVAADALVVAYTFVEQAELLWYEDTNKASAALQLARHWAALKAAAHLPQGQADPRVEEVESRIQGVEAAIDSLSGD